MQPHYLHPYAPQGQPMQYGMGMPYGAGMPMQPNAQVIPQQHQQPQQPTREWTAQELNLLNRVIVLNQQNTTNPNELANLISKYIQTKTLKQILEKVQQQFKPGTTQAQQSAPAPSNPKKRKRESDSSQRKKSKTSSSSSPSVSQTTSNSARQLENIIKSGESNEENTEQQESLIGNVLEENQEMIVGIRRNLQNSKFDDNIPLMNTFRKNIKIVLDSLENMGGISSKMAPLGVHLA